MDDEQRFQQALAAHRAGDLARAEAGYRALLATCPESAPLYVNLASIRTARGAPAEAILLLERAVGFAPEHVNAWNQLGLAYAAAARLDDADRAYERALAIDPHHLAALNNAALAKAARKHVGPAFELYQRALAVAPDSQEALQNLGALLLDAGKLSDAETCLRRLLDLAPDNGGAMVNLANVLTRRGRATEALPLFAKAVATRPDDASWHSALLMTLHYPEGPSPLDIFSHHLRWGRLRTANRPSGPAHPGRARGPKLRIGYLSPDLKSHAVAFFLAPLLREHDRARYEVFAYANVQHEDATSAKLRQSTDSWQNVFALDDDALAARILADRIDVLVDLAGHTAGNRLLAVAKNPAPVQMTYLGYPNTTGTRAIGYRMTDAWCDPDGAELTHSEALLRLEGGMHCYEPPADAPAVTEPPCASRGYLTFGSFNNTSKLTESAIARWAGVLRAIPDARMRMKFPTLGDRETGADYLRWFAAHGVDPSRVSVLGASYAHGSHLAEHAEVDVILDAFPYHGTTTTCEALWMGVPVLTVVGETHVSRVGLSLLAQVGLTSFAAPDEAVRVARALELATPEGRASLAALRNDLRPRMAGSSLCDARAKSRAVERAIEAAWSAFERWQTV